MAANAVFQRQSIQELHGNESLPVLVINFVDGADVRMIQRGGGLGFSLKAGECLRVFSYTIRKELEGDESPELYIFSLIDHTHTASAQLLDDAVVRNGLADHTGPIILGQSRLPDHICRSTEKARAERDHIR
jgi:hypothetical protein